MATSKRKQTYIRSALTVLCGLILPISHANADGPLVLDVVYTGEVLNNLLGGIKTGTRYIDNLDLTADYGLNLDGNEGTFFVYGLYNNNTGMSEDIVGDLQVISNLDNTRNFRLYEAWYNQEFNDGATSFKLGLIDLNSEFDAIDTAGLFYNSSHGIGADFSQSGENGPSIFPVTSLAARFERSFSDTLLFRVGIFDSVPGDPDRPSRNVIELSEGALFVGEVNFTPNDDLRIGIGTWAYTDKADLILPENSVTQGKNNGVYAFADAQLSRELGSEDQGLRGWVRFGVADQAINQVGTYIGGGIVYTGPVDGRDEDQFGIAFASARNGSQFKSSRTRNNLPVDGGETVIEMNYRFQINDWMAFQPDLQYILNTGALGELDNAFIATFRFEIGHSF